MSLRTLPKEMGDEKLLMVWPVWWFTDMQSAREREREREEPFHPKETTSFELCDTFKETVNLPKIVTTGANLLSHLTINLLSYESNR